MTDGVGARLNAAFDELDADIDRTLWYCRKLKHDRTALLDACKYVAGRLQAGDCEYDDVASMVLNLQAAIAKAESAE